MKPKRYELTDRQWERVAGMLPGKVSDSGRSGSDNRLFVNAVLWVLRSGAHWHDLPERYEKWTTAHKRFTRGAKAGVWEKVFDDLSRAPDDSYLMLDSTIIRAHQQAATGKGGGRRSGPDEALGRSRGGLTTKVPMLADGIGRPVRVAITPGQRGDATQALALLDGLAPERVLADRAYDSNALRAAIAAYGAGAVIPCNPTRHRSIPDDAEADKARNRVERFVSRLKHFRRFATRYDRRQAHFRAFVIVACCTIWLR